MKIIVFCRLSRSFSGAAVARGRIINRDLTSRETKVSALNEWMNLFPLKPIREANQDKAEKIA